MATVLIFPRYERNHTEAPLSWDVSGYYLYLPALFIYKDLQELKFLPDIIDTYKPSPSADQAFLHSKDNNGQNRMVMKYPLGMALLYLPFFLISHLIAGFGHYPSDGFSWPYQVMVQLGSACVAILGLFLLKLNLRRFFTDKASGLAILLIAVGTNFFNYATFDAPMPHVFLFTLFTLLFHLTLRWHEKPSWIDAAGIGICIGIAGLVRPTELLAALIPLMLGIAGFRSLKEKYWLLIRNSGQILLAVFLAAATGFLQLAYWKFASGEWIVYSYQDQGFSFNNPHFVDVFFSFRKGWLVYTPLMAFALLGFIALFAQQKKLFLAVFLFFLINAWIVSAWDIWWYGGSFGQRAMIQSYALLAFPFAALLQWILLRNWRKWVLLPMMLACLVLNLFQTYQAHWGPFESDMMTKAYYLRIFGKIINNPYDRFLIDTNEYFSENRKNFKETYSTNFENLLDSLDLASPFPQSGKNGLWVDENINLSKYLTITANPEMQPGKWLHISASYFSPAKEWEIWWMPQTVVSFEQKGQVIKERFFRPFHVLNVNEWRVLGLDVQIPMDKFDTLKIFLRNPRNSSALYMDDVRIGIYEQ
jgi:hypothetical protein